ncbi:MAG: hypothetical protein QM808_09180 [Steroidobacteraceae bacterium]
MGFISSLFGRASAATPQVNFVGEDGFVDLDLPLVEISEKGSGSLRLLARGTFEKQMLGFIVEVNPEWKPQQLEGGDAIFYWGTVTLRSLGPASDAFVSLIARLYDQRVEKPRMLAEIKAEAVGLDSDPRKIKTNPVHMKLFFHSESEERYAEVYVNVDVAGKVVQFHEKDPEYRENVIRALTENA